jgi:beta-dihydromenaquinone-9 omega-hydroxylase
MSALLHRGSAGMALTLGRTMAVGVGRETRAVARTAWRRRRRDPAGGAAPIDVDPLDPEVLADPYPWYRSLHNGARVHYSVPRGVWILSRHEDVKAAARAHDAFSSAESITPYRSSLPMLIVSDRPEHTRLRRLLAAHFTREAIDRYRPAIEAISARAIDRLLAGAENPGGAPVDAVECLSGPVPVEVIAHILGVPEADRGRFREWSDRVIEGFAVAPGHSPLRKSASVLGATMSLHAYFRRAFERRVAAPEEDLLSHLNASSAEGRLSREERFWFALLLLVAGNETTTSLLGSMLLALAENPASYRRLRAEPGLAAAAIEESLRFGSPVQGFYRSALSDRRVGQATIPARGRVLLLFGAANRDPDRFPDPDRFALDRDPEDHLAFGSGIHFCLGAHLARLEATVVLRQLVERVTAIELAGTPRWNGNPALRGLTRLPLRLTS